MHAAPLDQPRKLLEKYRDLEVCVMETLVLRNKWHPRIKRDIVAAISEGSPGTLPGRERSARHHSKQLSRNGAIRNFARTQNILSGEVSRGPLGLINQFSLVHLLSVRTDHYCSISVLSHAFAFLSRSCYSVVRFPSQRKSRSDFSATQ